MESTRPPYTNMGMPSPHSNTEAPSPHSNMEAPSLHSNTEAPSPYSNTETPSPYSNTETQSTYNNMETQAPYTATEVLLSNYGYDNPAQPSTGQDQAQHFPDPGYFPGPKRQETRHSAAEKTPHGRQGCWSKAVGSLSPWGFELLNVLFSILAFVAIIIFLRVYEGKTLEEWGLPISLNAVVAILSALFKGSLVMPITEGISQLKWIWFSNQSRSLADMDVYDRASRGPWGSLLFITKQFTRGKRSYLASLGAIIVLVALAVDPFSQATVDYRSCLTKSLTTSLRQAAIPRATRYNAFGSHQSVSQQSLDGPMQLAIYLGLLDPPANSSASVAANCPTGNCTFPSDQGATFSTLSMCHSCLDLSDTVTNHSFIWNFSMPGGLSLTAPTLLNTTLVPPVGDSWDKIPLLAFDALTLRYADLECTKNSTCPMEPFAFRCSLTPCLKTYAANFTSSEYREKEVSSKNLRYSPVTTRDFSLAVNRTLQDGTWKNCNATDHKTKTNIVEVFIGNNTHTGGSESKEILENYTGTETTTMWYPPECVYVYGILAREGVHSFLPDFFDGKGLSFAAVVAANTGPTWLQTLWNNGTADMGSVGAFVQGLATSMGGQIRKNPGDATAERQMSPGDAAAYAAAERPVLGQSWDTHTCIRVRWPFLSFLAVLLALELVFVVAVMVASRLSRWDGDWKSSTLALLFHGPGAAASENKEGVPLSSAAMMLDAAKQMKTRLEERGDGDWRLAEVT